MFSSSFLFPFSYTYQKSISFFFRNVWCILGGKKGWVLILVEYDYSTIIIIYWEKWEQYEKRNNQNGCSLIRTNYYRAKASPVGRRLKASPGIVQIRSFKVHRALEKKNCSRAAAKSLVAVRRVIFHRWKEMALFECTCECEKLAIEIKERFLNGRRLIVFDFLSNGSWDDFQKIVKWGGKYQLAKGNLGRLGKTK